MDWDNAMQNMIATEVQKQLEPIRSELAALQQSRDTVNDAIGTVILRIGDMNKRLQSAEQNLADHERAIGNNDGRADLSGRLDAQAATIHDALSRIMEIGRRHDAHTEVVSQLNRRFAALEYVRVPITEIEPQDLDGAIRERVQPLRDDLDDLAGKHRSLAHVVEETNGDLNRAVEIATDAHKRIDNSRICTENACSSRASHANKRIDELEDRLDRALLGINGNALAVYEGIDVRLSAIEARHAAEEPAKAPETIENICAALEAAYVAYVQRRVEQGAQLGEIVEGLEDLHHDAGRGAFVRTWERLPALVENHRMTLYADEVSKDAA